MRPVYGGNITQSVPRMGQPMGGKGGGMGQPMGGKGGGQLGRPMTPELRQMTDAMINPANKGRAIAVAPQDQAFRTPAPPQTLKMFEDILRAQGGNGYQGSQNVSGMIDRRTPEIRAAQEAYRMDNPQQVSPLAGLASLSGIYRGMR
jgi:hypothetical protein